MRRSTELPAWPTRQLRHKADLAGSAENNTEQSDRLGCAYDGPWRLIGKTSMQELTQPLHRILMTISDTAADSLYFENQ